MSDDEPSSDKRSIASRVSSYLKKGSHLFSKIPKNRDGLLSCLRKSAEKEIIDANSLAMIEGVLQISEIRVREIMMPRSQMIVVEKDMSLPEILSVVLKTVHSRFPVIGDSKDEVLGILLAKDLLPYGFPDVQPTEVFNLQTILRPVSFIPESKRLDVLLQEFRTSRNHMAVVVDEYGGITGLLTIEDVLEQIVGNIEDEYDTEDDKLIRKYGDSGFMVRALTPVEVFNEHFKTNFDDSAVDTIGGIVMRAFGHLPRKGEVIILGDHEFKILRADRRRIYLLQVAPRVMEEE
jgi:magnesium and cobalt transporter